MANMKIPDLGGATMDAVDVGSDNYIHPNFFLKPEDQKRVFESVPNFKFRDDDIMLCGYPKCGTHWLFELMSMLVNKSSEVFQTPSSKVKTMMEGFLALEIDDQPSPRILSSHYPPRYLPVKGLTEKQIKTVVVVRNPKDVAVSYYHHMRGITAYDYSGKWEDWLPVYIQGKCECGKYTTYLREWEELITKGPGFPLHVIYYEDMKRNPYEEINKLTKMFGIEMEDKMKGEIQKICGFDCMKERSEKAKVHEAVLKGDFKFFRKGAVGDWRNMFTEEQNKMFDEAWNTDMKDSNQFFKFTYE